MAGQWNPSHPLYYSPEEYDRAARLLEEFTGKLWPEHKVGEFALRLRALLAAERAEQRRRDAEVVRGVIPDEVRLYSEERGSYSEKEDADAALERAARAVEAQGDPP